MKYVINSLFFGILAGSAFYAFTFAMDLPDVKFSYSTDECVEVINYNSDDKYSCENLPTKFNHVWVK